MGDISNLDVGWRSALMFAVCGPLFFVALSLFFRGVERAANFWLACFLLVAVIAQIPQVIGFSGFYAVWPGLTFAPFAVSLYIGPLIYLHADQLMRGGTLGWRKYLLVPGLVQTFYYSWAFLTLGDYRAKWDYNDAFHTPFVEPVETATAIALVVLALVGVFRLVSRYKDFLENTQSAAKDFDPSWLNQLVVASAAAAIVFAGLEFIPIFIHPISYISAFPAQIVLTLIIAWLGFEALIRTQTPFPKLSEWEAATQCRSKSADETRVIQSERLREAITNGRWYLEPRLSIRDVAQRMASNETYISRALNQGLGMNFNSYVNHLRIQHAEQMIVESEKSLLEIAFASGFNSKATFNRVFKSLNGQSPSAYRASQRP